MQLCVSQRCSKALLARRSSRCQGLAGCSSVNKPRSLALPAVWLARLIVRRWPLFLLLLLLLLLLLSEVGKPWVGIWFWGTDTFHGWRRNKSLKREPALGRHSVNTYNTTPLTAAASLLNNLFLVCSCSPFSPSPPLLLLECWGFFYNFYMDSNSRLYTEFNAVENISIF